MGHSMSDPGNYRTRSEIERYQERDPIKLLLANLKEQNLIDDAQVEAIEKEVREVVDHSVKFAEESPEPAPEELYTNVYASPIKPNQNR
jgi:pyruvate dehydrogenase E1 component alpha subunit